MEWIKFTPALLFLLAAAGGAEASIKIWQVTDVHLDTRYSEAGNASNWCHEEARDDLDDSEDDLLEERLGMYGNFRCDAPWVLVKSAISAMRDFEPDPDIILWTGDSSAHGTPSEVDFDYVLSAERTLSTYLRKYFPNALILPVLGNHDSSPPDYFPENRTFYTYFLANSGWADLIPEESARNEFANGCGFYKHDLPDPGLSLIVLNTNVYYKNNNTDFDPCQQITWLEDQLKAVPEGGRVFITAHVPPGFFERDPDAAYMVNLEGDHHYNEALSAVLHKYGQKIMAHAYGHTHTDSFRLIQVPGTTPTSVAFQGSSVTPLVTGPTGTNPGIRLYYMDPGSPYLRDYDQYYLDLPTANAERKAVFKHLYRFSDIYGMPDMSLDSMKRVFRKLSEDDDLFGRYYAYNTLLHDNGPCDATCRKEHLCAISQVTTDGLMDCLNSDGLPTAEPLTMRSDVVEDEEAKNAGLSVGARVTVAMLVLVCTLLFIMIALFAVQIRYFKQARQNNYSPL